MIKPNVIEENFGLRVILNSVQHENIKGTKKHNIGAVIKRSDEQMSKGVSTADFGIDIEQDLLTGLRGRSNYAFLGRTILGTDALFVNADINIKTLKPFLLQCYSRYQSQEYKKHFDWVDHISFVRSAALVKKLKAELIKELNKGDFTNICVSPPIVIDDMNVKGFTYIPYQKTVEDDIDTQKLIDSFRSLHDVDQLEGRKVKAIGEDGNVKDSWSVYNCISTELSLAGRQYVIANGKWYEVSIDYVREVNSFIKDIELSKLKLPAYTHNNEGEYNEAVCNLDKDRTLMDKKNINYGGGRSKIEFCDVYTKWKDIIHIKRKGGSSVLSHLFNQGVVSGELLASDREFRIKLNTHLKTGFKVPEVKITAADFRIIFGIICKGKKSRPPVPFFSKITLRNAVKRLRALGYSVELLHIHEKQ